MCCYNNRRCLRSIGPSLWIDRSENKSNHDNTGFHLVAITETTHDPGMLVMALQLIEAGQSIGSGNGLSPVRHQVITATNTDLSIGSLASNVSEVVIKIQTFFWREMHLKMPSAKWRSFYLNLGVLKVGYVQTKFTGSSDSLHQFHSKTGMKDSSSSNGYPSNLPHFVTKKY